MVDEWISEGLQKSENFKRAGESYSESMRIVPTIMGLGVARLRAAQAESDRTTRLEFLKKAEETFLSLRNSRGETDEYRMFLGQIYFWSGRESEGRALFDKLLESNGRNFSALFQVASIYRELGELGSAKPLLEEALLKATNDAEKAGAVVLRSMLATRVDEKIRWLEKGPTEDFSITIQLAEARGQKEQEAGNRERAAAYYRQALSGYGKQARSSSSLNNSAILHRALYSLDGDPADFEAAARMFSEAFELNPSDSILSYNAAESQLASAVVRIATAGIHPKVLQRHYGLGVLRFLYRDQAEKETWIARLKSDPSFRKAVSHLWDTLLLAPKNREAYLWGAGVFSFIGDQESLERLVQKAGEQKFDFTEDQAELERHMRKENDEQIRSRLKVEHQNVTDLIADLGDDRRAKAMTRSLLAEVRLGSFGIDQPIESTAWIGDLKAAAAEFPCAKLEQTVAVALELAALENLASKYPDCAAIIEANRRLIGPNHTFRLLARAKGDIGERVRSHPVVREARDAIHSCNTRFPATPDVDDWLALEGLHPEEDAALKEAVVANLQQKAEERLLGMVRFDPPSVLIGEFWSKILEGDAEGAKRLHGQLEAQGVALPPLF